jgi:hypothetical protein
MRWATRARVHIDRAACAWVIRRFVDPGAEFVFVEEPADVPPDVTAFDMRGVALSHHQGRCTFETALLQFDLTGVVAGPRRQGGAAAHRPRSRPRRPGRPCRLPGDRKARPTARVAARRVGGVD